VRYCALLGSFVLGVAGGASDGVIVCGPHVTNRGGQQRIGGSGYSGA
jgi:hypothetical protein